MTLRSTELEELYAENEDAAIEYVIELLREWCDDREDDNLPSDFGRWVDRIRERARHNEELRELVYTYDDAQNYR